LGFIKRNKQTKHVESKFTKFLIEFVFVETNEVVHSHSNVILKRQAVGQRAKRVAGSKRRAVTIYFS